jgi:predicted O-methyltransferase YrrM
MSIELWKAVDQYIDLHLVGEDAALLAATESARRAGLPPISVTASQGKLLYLLVRAQRARSVLEIGALAGYSTIWLGRAVGPGGTVVSLEIEERCAVVARENVARAGLGAIVDIRLGAALETLPRLVNEGPFDFIFIDADKDNVPAYFDWAVRLSRPGAMIVVDNVVRDGKVLDPENTDPDVGGVRRLHEQLANDRRISATTIQTVGSKGHDGLTVAVVNG